MKIKLINLFFGVLIGLSLIFTFGCGSPSSSNEATASVEDGSEKQKSQAQTKAEEYQKALKEYKAAADDAAKNKALEKVKNLKTDLQQLVDDLDAKSPATPEADEAHVYLRKIMRVYNADKDEPKVDDETLTSVDGWTFSRAEYAQDCAAASRQAAKSYKDAMREYSNATDDTAKNEALEKAKKAKASLERYVDLTRQANTEVKDDSDATEEDKTKAQDAENEAQEYLDEINTTWDSTMNVPITDSATLDTVFGFSFS